MENTYLTKWFNAKRVAMGGPIRRLKANVLKHCPLEQLRAAVLGRGWSLFEHGDQFVIFTSPSPTPRILQSV